MSATWDFALAVSWTFAFFVLEPITDATAVKYMHHRLVLSGFEVMSLADMIALDQRGLCSCTCPCFLKHAWCKHTCADAMSKNIILRYPPTLDPTALGKRKRGRLPKAKAGQWS